MTTTTSAVIVQYMETDNRIRLLVLEEFRLRAADLDGEVARIVAATPNGLEPTIPLLTSIEDRRDVATLRAVRADESTEVDTARHTALDPLVSRWGAPKHYGPRITEHSQSPPSSYRMAVTESGINARTEAPVTPRESSMPDSGANRAVGLVWIGAPVGTHAGLLVLLGSYDDPLQHDYEPFGWPLPLSRDLGVRIYENHRA